MRYDPHVLNSMSAVCWSVRHLPPSRSLTSFIHSVLCLGSTTSCRSLATTRCSRNLAVSTSKEKWLLRKKGSGAQSQGLREDEDEDHADEQSRLLCVRTYQCHGIIFSHPQAFDVFNLTDSRFRSFFCNPDISEQLRWGGDARPRRRRFRLRVLCTQLAEKPR